MNIVMYINKLYKGGAERVMANLAADMHRRGHSVTLVTDYSSEEDYPLPAGVDRYILSGKFQNKNRFQKILQYLERIKKLRRIAKEQKADLIVSFIKMANQRALLSTLFSPVKNIISVRIDPKHGYKSRLHAAWYKALYRLSDGCVFQTEEAQQWYPEAIQKKSRVICNPVAEQCYNVFPGEKKKTIVTCGRLSQQKNYTLLVEAFSLIHDEFPDYKLLIYGTGPLKEKLQREIDEKQLTEDVVLAGRCDNVPETIKDASLFVLSSDYEGLPNALMEAMALGLPCISTDFSGGGAGMLIRDNINGLIVPCSDPRSLADAMRKVLSDTTLAQMLSANAKASSMAFRSERICEQWENYFIEIVDGKQRVSMSS